MLTPINKGARLQTSGVKGYMDQARKIKGAQQQQSNSSSKKRACARQKSEE